MISFRPSDGSKIRFQPREAPALWCSLALAMGSAAPVHAETTDDDPEGDKRPRIIVTGEKKSEVGLDRIATPLIDTPQAISVVTKEDLEDRGITNLNDALRNVAGLTLGAGEGRFQGNSPNLRGFTTVNDLFVDNVRDFGSYFRDSFDDETIEVLKGPSSILFGRGSTGGIIHRVSKKPVADDFGAVELLAGTDETRRITGDVNLAGIAGDGSAFRVNAMYHESMVAGRDFGRSQRWGVAPKLIFGLGSDTRLFLGYVHQSERNRPDYGLPWFPGGADAPGAPAAVDPSNFYGFTNDFLNTDVDIFTAKIDHSFNAGLRVRTIFRYSRAERAFRITEPQIARGTPADTPLSQISISRLFFDGSSTDEFFQNQTDLTAEFETGALRHTLIVGGDIARESPNTVLRDNFDIPATSLTDPETIFFDNSATSFVRLRSRPRSTGIGLFALDTIELGDRWQAIIGLRWDSFRTDFTGEAFNRAGDRTELGIDRTDRNLSYRAALVYKPAANGSVYVGYANSFNPSGEGVESVISSGRGFSTQNINLEPETSYGVELGTKWAIFDERVLLTASLFRIEKDQVRVPDPDVPGFNTLGGRQRVDGAEIEFNGEILPGWTVRGSYTFIDSQTLETTPGGPLQGAPLLQTPRHMATFGTKYDVTQHVTLGANFVTVGERLGQNRANSFLVAPGFSVVDLNAKYQITDRMFVRVLVNNLFDRVYFEQLHPFHVIPGPRRTALASLQWSF